MERVEKIERNWVLSSLVLKKKERKKFFFSFENEIEMKINEIKT